MGVNEKEEERCRKGRVEREGEGGGGVRGEITTEDARRRRDEGLEERGSEEKEEDLKRKKEKRMKEEKEENERMKWIRGS